MNIDQRIAHIFRTFGEYALTCSVVCVSCGAYFILRQYGLDALAAWFLPDSLHELLQTLSIWRLWTPIFIHYTLIHLLTNLYIWWLFATQIERQSRFELLALVMFAAATSNGLQWWVSGPQFGGLSGVVYALLSYLWILGRYRGNDRYRVDPALGIILLALLPLAGSGVFGKFANSAHIGGLVSGAALAVIRHRFVR